MDIDINSDFLGDHVSAGELSNGEQKAIEALSQLKHKTGEGSEFTGWMNLPSNTNSQFLDSLVECAEMQRRISSVLVVIGIGGSYLGARAVIEALSASFTNSKKHTVVYAGHHLSEEYHVELMSYLDQLDYSMAIISKSGTTTEPAIAFRLIKKHMEAKYGIKEARKRIIAITDKEKGSLKELSLQEGYTTFTIEEDIGGRYSVLSPVGLFPIAFAGFSIHDLIHGSLEAEKYALENDQQETNPALKYALIRNILFQKNYSIELLSTFNPQLYYFTEWWKQLFGESEGKDGKGIFPAACVFSTDLHSLGQYIQDGQRILFETVISVESVHKKLKVPGTKDNVDGLNYLAGRRLHEINLIAEQASILAHYSGKVPVIIIRVPGLNERIIGQLIYFFELACGISGYILGVNPFDQPGVENYKKNMFRLLGKPGIN